MPRLFTAIEIPEIVRSQLALVRGHLAGAKWVETEDMHVTIRFIDLGDGRTSLANTTRFASLEDLDTGTGMGMDEGWASTLANLEVVAGSGLGARAQGGVRRHPRSSIEELRLCDQ